MFTAKEDNLVLMQTTLLQVPFEQVLAIKDQSAATWSGSCIKCIAFAFRIHLFDLLKWEINDPSTLDLQYKDNFLVE